MQPEASTNLDVHAAMTIFQAWARNGGVRPEHGPARLLPRPFAKNEFGGKSENMKLARAVLNGLEWGDWTNLETLLKRYATTGHQGDEIFPASHDQINHASAGTALLVVLDLVSLSGLVDLLVEWHQRQFHLCQLLDTTPLKDSKGHPVGPYGPGARADKTTYGNNGGRTLAYLATQGLPIRAAQLADRSNTGALAIKALPESTRVHLLEIPKTLVLSRKLHIGRNLQDYVAWFPDAPESYVAVAGVWDGKPFASRALGPDDEAKIKECSNIEIIG